MTEPAPNAEPPRYWTRSDMGARWNGRDLPPFQRFIGGSPLGVAAKLVLVSLIVGALLVWLDIRPAELFREVSAMVDRIWALGFQSLREFGTYFVAGAVIVVPIWFVLRLLSYRGRP